MSGVKHTPWEVAETIHDDEGFPEIVIRAGRIAVAVALGGLPAELQQSNARLIAAAPDLLEAGAELQAARKVQNADPSAANALRVRRASDAFDAAIARARGEQDGGGE